MNTLINESDMPAPRLELLWSKDGDSWAERICTYSLVLPLGEHDIRREVYNKEGDLIKTQDVQKLEIGKTRVTGGWGSPLQIDPQDGPFIDTPFRDGSHARWDSKALGGFPVYAVCDGKAMLVPTEE